MRSLYVYSCVLLFISSRTHRLRGKCLPSPRGWAPVCVPVRIRGSLCPEKEGRAPDSACGPSRGGEGRNPCALVSAGEGRPHPISSSLNVCPSFSSSRCDPAPPRARVPLLGARRRPCPPGPRPDQHSILSPGPGPVGSKDRSKAQDPEIQDGDRQVDTLESVQPPSSCRGAPSIL